MRKLRFKQFLRERNQFSKTGDESLLSVSEYYGVKPRAEAFQSEEHESRAATLEGYRIVKKDDLVMNYMLAWKGAYGISDHEGIVSPAYSVFKVDQNTVDVRYLHHRTRSNDMKAYFRSRSKGIIDSRLRLYPDSLLASYVEIPDLATQRQIADFLDRETARIDLLIEKKQRLVALLAERFNARRNDEFQQIPGSQYQPLRWLIFQICDGPFGSGLTSAHYSETGVRVIRLQNIKDGGFDETDAAFISDDHYATLGDHDVKAGDLLIAGLGDEKNKVGRACVAPCDLGAAMVKADCYRVRLKKNLISHFFAAEYLCSGESWPQIDALAKGVTRSRLNLELVRRIRMPVPSLAEQNDIMARINEERQVINSVFVRVSASIDRLKEYRGALIAAAVTGQIDVQTYARSGATNPRLDAIREEMAP